MALNSDNLIWVDMEMSGLNPDTDKVLEVAIVVTDHVRRVPVVVATGSDLVAGAPLLAAGTEFSPAALARASRANLA